jgi:uncharacterized membrane protein YhiD involved in acid resistance
MVMGQGSMKHITDWLQDPAGMDASFSSEEAIKRLGLALAAGFVVAGVYVIGMGRRREESNTLPTTLVLLTVVIAVVTLVIGNSVARAFGLVGALSIVRFRTVVEDTRDTAFVIFAVVVGMAIGAGYPLLAALGVPAVLIAAVLMRWVNGETPPVKANGNSTLTVRFALNNDPDALLAETFARHLTDFRLSATSTAKQGAALEATYKVKLKSPGKAFVLVADLNKIEGVQGVEFKN